MCGIAGYQGDFTRAFLEGMTCAVAHRGPDASGTVALRADGAAPVGLGHRRLAIIDLSPEGNQPMTTHCEACRSAGMDDLALVFNGEIYNFRELRRGLESAGHRFHGHSDSEVLLHLYAAEGPAMLAKLNGIFAFAIHDGRAAGRPEGIERGDLFVARDPLGVKPLYMAQLPSGFVFASELKALLPHPELSREIDLVALHSQLAYLWTPAPRTILRGVQKLAPGYALVARGGRMAREWCFYDIPYGAPELTGSEDAIARQLRATLREAVERQLVADVPVGAFLSGGLDSSAVVALMREVQPGSALRCYSIGFEGGEAIDGAPADLPYARRVARHLGVDLHELEVTPGIIDQLDRMLWHLDEPNADPAPINALLIAEQARKEGITVLLSGAGGDDIFSGYRRHRALQLERVWERIPAGARSFIGRRARSVAMHGGPAVRTSLGRRLVKLASQADLAVDERMIAYFWWNSEEMRHALYAPAVAAELASVDAATPLMESLARIPHVRDPLNRMLYLETKHFLADHNLNYTDKMGMAVGVEVRVPLLDLEVVELAARIPPRFKQQGRVGKAIFKRAMRDDLPHDVVYRPKSGFGVPLRRWLNEELRPRVDALLSPEVVRRRGIFDPDAVQRLLALDRAGRIDGAYTVFALMCFELWCQQCLD
jgi:asparagine synthase (glutamine-hydrolysing)